MDENQNVPTSPDPIVPGATVPEEVSTDTAQTVPDQGTQVPE